LKTLFCRSFPVRGTTKLQLKQIFFVLVGKTGVFWDVTLCRGENRCENFKSRMVLFFYREK